MAKQSEPRIPKKVRVKVRGRDTNGNPFVQTALTVNISRSGARLDDLACLRGPGEIIELRRRWKRARFRVIWLGQIGTPEARQAGVRCLEPEKRLWGRKFSAD